MLSVRCSLTPISRDAISLYLLDHKLATKIHHEWESLERFLRSEVKDQGHMCINV